MRKIMLINLWLLFCQLGVLLLQQRYIWLELEMMHNYTRFICTCPYVETFSVTQILTLFQEHPFVSRKWMILTVQLTFQMLIFRNKIIFTARASISKHGIANLWPSSLISDKHSAWIQMFWVQVPLCPGIFCFKKDDTCSRTSVRELKMNAVARAELKFQMLTLETKIFIPQEPIFKTWDSNCLASIVHVVSIRHESKGLQFNSPLSGDISCLKTFLKNIHSWVANDCFCPRTVNTYKQMCVYIYIHTPFFAWGRHENMSSCPGSGVHSNHELIASCAGCQ